MRGSGRSCPVESSKKKEMTAKKQGWTSVCDPRRMKTDSKEEVCMEISAGVGGTDTNSEVTRNQRSHSVCSIKTTDRMCL